MQYSHRATPSHMEAWELKSFSSESGLCHPQINQASVTLKKKKEEEEV